MWTRNFELDSLAYFLMYLWNYWTSPGLYRPEALLVEPLVHDAVVTVLKVLEIEQHHEERSPYRYSEIPRDGLGPPTKYTGGDCSCWSKVLGIQRFCVAEAAAGLLPAWPVPPLHPFGPSL